MGGGASTANVDLTVVKARITALGYDGEKWTLDVAAISNLSKEEKVQKLKEIGIENNAHQESLIADFETLSKKNSAFVFIKPHANTSHVQELVKSVFQAQGVHIIAEGEIKAEDIDKDMLIDNHYYAIASKATLLKPAALPVPADKFEAEFGKSWKTALEEGVVYNALDASSYLSLDAAALDALFQKSQKVKFGGGFYCAKIEVPDKPIIYVFNGFFMSLRAKFVTPGTSIHYYNVSFDPSKLAWKDFRGKVLGPTDPSQAPADSLRGQIYTGWEKLGLKAIPNVGDNGVHASASPFEGLAERMNWLKASVTEDIFGAKLISAGLSVDTINAYKIDPQVKGKSLFDQLEDKDCDDCIATIVELAK